MLQVTARSTLCSARRGWADQVQAKQQLVTEAGQRGCWDTQRLNRQPACHPLFFSSPYTQHIASDPSRVSLKQHGEKRVSYYHKKGANKEEEEEEKKTGPVTENAWMITGRGSSPSFHLTSWIVLLYTYRWYSTFLCCTIPCKQGSKRRWFGANYSQHVFYTPFNELVWRHGHWLWLACPVIQDEPCNLPHVTPVMCTKSPSTSNSQLGLHWSRDEAPLKQHNSSRSVSAHQWGRSWREWGCVCMRVCVWQGWVAVGGWAVEQGAHSHNYNN